MRPEDSPGRPPAARGSLALPARTVRGLAPLGLAARVSSLPLVGARGSFHSPLATPRRSLRSRLAPPARSFGGLTSVGRPAHGSLRSRLPTIAARPWRSRFARPPPSRSLIRRRPCGRAARRSAARFREPFSVSDSGSCSRGPPACPSVRRRRTSRRRIGPWSEYGTHLPVRRRYVGMDERGLRYEARCRAVGSTVSGSSADAASL